MYDHVVCLHRPHRHQRCQHNHHRLHHRLHRRLHHRLHHRFHLHHHHHHHCHQIGDVYHVLRLHRWEPPLLLPLSFAGRKSGKVKVKIFIIKQLLLLTLSFA